MSLSMVFVGDVGVLVGVGRYWWIIIVSSGFKGGSV